MSIEVKYAVANNSKHEKKLKKAASGSASYGLFAADIISMACYAHHDRIKNLNSLWLFWKSLS